MEKKSVKNSKEKCLIAYYSDGTYRYVSCGGDGYPAAVGKVLLESYNSTEEASALVDGGDIDVLDVHGKLLYYTSDGPGMGACTDESKSDIFSWYDPVEVDSEDALTGAAEESMVSWVYLYIGGCWCYKRIDNWHRLDSDVKTQDAV